LSRTDRTAVGLGFLAAVLFLALFRLQGVGPPLDFWWGMAGNITLLVGLTFALDRPGFFLVLTDLRSRPWKKITSGIASALVLYLIFYAAGSVLRAALPFASSGIAGVYAFRRGASTLRIALLMALVIGPGEELFWRCYLQRHWQSRIGARTGWLAAAALYGLVHLSSGNILLVLAALACGLFWGALYLRYRSPLLNMVSHTLWDILIFLAFPLG
jgi:membrane protease YdiL (CAAX protease family)